MSRGSLKYAGISIGPRQIRTRMSHSAQPTVATDPEMFRERTFVIGWEKNADKVSHPKYKPIIKYANQTPCFFIFTDSPVSHQTL